MKVISIREYPELLQPGIEYVYRNWGNVNNSNMYRDCMEHSMSMETLLPRWYLMLDENRNDKIVGCAGLIINDFISRADLYPWLSSLHVDSDLRGNSYGGLLIVHVKEDAKKAGFKKLYLATDFVGYYEKYGFNYLATGYHPWGESSRIYETSL